MSTAAAAAVAMPSALPAGGAVPYDAYSPDHHLHGDQPPSSQQHHHQQPAATGGGGSPSVPQRWYELSDGAVTPPDDSSSSSHRGDVHAALPPLPLPLPHGVTSAKRRPLGCRLVASVALDALLLAALAVSAYFLRLLYSTAATGRSG